MKQEYWKEKEWAWKTARMQGKRKNKQDWFKELNKIANGHTVSVKACKNASSKKEKW